MALLIDFGILRVSKFTVLFLGGDEVAYNCTEDIVFLLAMTPYSIFKHKLTFVECFSVERGKSKE